ncbi:MAG: sterol desaturase family protein [Myxococcota bacterium]|nr:sterol desaturase family protein [Myxococcota bacterium]
MSPLIVITLLIAFLCNAFGFVFSYFILQTDAFGRLRIQKRRYRKGTFRKRLPLILLNLSILFVLVFVGLYFAEGFFDMEWQSWWSIAIQISVFVLLDDVYFYFYHRALHNVPVLYSKIHKIHHRAFAPFPMEYIYVHPLEWMLGTLGIVLAAVSIVLVNGQISVHAFWIFSVIRNLHEVDIHSGLRSLFAHKIPLFAATEHHDFHHRKNTKGNYGSMFTFWDTVMGTSIDMEEKPPKVKAALLS